MFRGKGTAGYRGGIVMTENGADSWQSVSADIGEAAITHVLIDPKAIRNQELYMHVLSGKGFINLSTAKNLEAEK